MIPIYSTTELHDDCKQIKEYIVASIMFMDNLI